jgi:hypothetical protein
MIVWGLKFQPVWMREIAKEFEVNKTMDLGLVGIIQR